MSKIINNNNNNNINIYNNYKSPFNGNISFGSNFNNLPKNLENILDSIKTAKNYEEYYYLVDDNPSLQKVHDDLYKQNQFYLKLCNEMDAEYDDKVLNGLQKKGIAITPEFVEKAVSPEGFAVSVLKINGTENGDLIDYQKGYNIVNDKLKNFMYKQLQKLTQLGIVNESVMTGKGIKITPDHNRILVDSWSDLAPVDEYMYDNNIKSRIELLKKIYDLIYLNK